MAKTRWVISSQRVLSSRQRSAESLRSLATSSLLVAAESWAAMLASLFASASESVTATPKTFKSFRVSSFIACLLFAASALHDLTVSSVHGGSRRLDPLYGLTPETNFVQVPEQIGGVLIDAVGAGS